MANQKKTVHVISHSHWDREWYMPLERHKMKLVDLFDNCMELFEKDPAYKSFHLDGQTIVLDDYLEICPEKRGQLKQCIQEGKFSVGPFYILQDEFLTSAEANVRNLQTGVRDAKAWGSLMNVAYFPDAFGNAGQMPQIMSQAGMDAVVFGRGVKPIGFDNEVTGGTYESVFSEMIWESPDHSSLLGILFANWYNNAAEIPVDEEQAKVFWDNCLADASRFAATGELLMMNGCDHQPVQMDLSQALDTARKLYPDIEFKHSSFAEYIQSVKGAVEEQLSTVTGELTSQETDGWFTLVNTCSAHVYLKILNRKNEVALEKMAEPLAAFASMEGKAYPHERLQYAWKILMQNHPHDSICGCSVDQVNKEMEIRFDRSTEVAKTVIEDASVYLADTVDTSIFEKYGENTVPFVVFNTSGWKQNKSVKKLLDAKRCYGGKLHQNYETMKAWELPSYKLIDEQGNEIPAQIKDMGVQFGYDLPDDKFRQPYMARQVEVSFLAENLPACGYKTYALAEGTPGADGKESLVCGENMMENARLKVSINEDGTLNVFDKKLDRLYEGLCYFEDTLDAGNEYIYFCPPQNAPILTKGKKADVHLIEDMPYRAVYEIVNTMTVPVSADETLAYEQESMVSFYQRTCGRSKETAEIVLHTFVTLEKDSNSIACRTVFENTAKDHRIRVIMPTGLSCTQHYAESVFEAVKRPNAHNACWENPCKCEHQQSFAGMNDEKGGMLAANIGLYEYEILPEEKNAIALTLVRAVGELGDWGVFKTELSQQLRVLETEYQLTFFAGDLIEAEGYRDAHQFQIPVTVVQTGIHKAKLPACGQFMEWKGDRIAFSGIKCKDNGTDIMARFYNCSGQESVLCIPKRPDFETLYVSNVLEEEVCVLTPGENGYEIPVKAYEIVTIGLRR
ncbi:MAG: alpha-mannosidase [Lachnospiraceae bacterium]|nr:alpha-mannosidase [Lachnospiraceae bacterium]